MSPLAGCSDPAQDTAGASTQRTRATAPTSDPTRSSAPADPETSADPEPTEPTTTEGATGDLGSRLLGAGAVPGFNEEFRWTGAGTTTQEPRTPFGTCQRFDISSIGATSVALRGYRPTVRSQDHAGELVAEFPDSTTAQRAFAVLKSWRAKCADQLQRYDRSEVGGLEDVSVDGGTAGWYLLTYGPLPGDPDSQYFDAQGMAVVGTRIAMVEMVLGGQDYNYEPGQEPMVAALQRAAARLS
jgi:hypothetical protein